MLATEAHRAYERRDGSQNRVDKLKGFFLVRAMVATASTLTAVSTNRSCQNSLWLEGCLSEHSGFLGIILRKPYSAQLLQTHAMMNPK